MQSTRIKHNYNINIIIPSHTPLLHRYVKKTRTRDNRE